MKWVLYRVCTFTDVLDSFYLCVVFSLAFSLNGCASLDQANTTALAQAAVPKQELTLSGTIDGNPFVGIAVGGPGPVHDFVIKSASAVNLFVIKSCHRSEKIQDFIKDGWLDPTSARWHYQEAPTIEDTGDCMVRMCAFSKEVGAAPSACAVVDFKSSSYTLPALNICNGLTGQTSGTALCHTQTGLLERFQFQAPVVTAPAQTDLSDPNNPVPLKIAGQCDGKFLDDQQTLFEYTVPNQECVIVFMERAKPHRKAKLTVIPYDVPKYSGGG